MITSLFLFLSSSHLHSLCGSGFSDTKLHCISLHCIWCCISEICILNCKVLRYVCLLHYCTRLDTNIITCLGQWVYHDSLPLCLALSVVLVVACFCLQVTDDISVSILSHCNLAQISY